MPSILLSDNGVSSGSAGLKTTAASDGSLALQTTTAGGAATTAVTIDTSQRAAFVAGTAALPAITTSGDTNTGIFFPAADTIAFAEGGAEAMRLDSSGNLGLGVTPSAWYSPNGTKVFQFAASGSLYGIDVSSTDRRVVLQNNAYVNAAGNEIYLNTGAATKSQQVNGQHQWYNAASGTAGNQITFTQAMTLDASGNLALGNTSSLSAASGRVDLTINGTSSAMTSFGTGGTRRGYVLHDATDFTIASETAGNIRFLNNGAERARIDSSGNLLAGTTAQGAYASRTTLSTDSGTTKWSTGPYNTSTAFIIAANATFGVYLPSTSATSWSSASDERVKTDLEPIENAIQKVSTLRAVTGRYKADDNNVRKAFLIAQDVLAVLPEAVDTTDPEKYGLAYTDTIPLLVAAIKEQQALITQLTTRITALEGN